MQKDKSILKDWTKEIVTGLVVAFVCWLTALIWSKVENKPINEIIEKLKTIGSKTFSFPIYYFIIVIVALYLFIKIKNIYFDKRLNTKIGLYTFSELHKILQAEFVTERTLGMEWAIREPVTASLLDQFIGFHVVLSQGVDFNTRLKDGGYIYGILCPKLHGYGLLDKVSKVEEDVGITTHSYSLSENGKLFWATLNKLKKTEN